jgi:hypothetical protein
VFFLFSFVMQLFVLFYPTEVMYEEKTYRFVLVFFLNNAARLYVLLVFLCATAICLSLSCPCSAGLFFLNWIMLEAMRCLVLFMHLSSMSSF